MGRGLRFPTIATLYKHLQVSLDAGKDGGFNVCSWRGSTVLYTELCAANAVSASRGRLACNLQHIVALPQ